MGCKVWGLETASAPARAAPESPHIPLSHSHCAGAEAVPEIDTSHKSTRT